MLAWFPGPPALMSEFAVILQCPSYHCKYNQLANHVFAVLDVYAIGSLRGHEKQMPIGEDPGSTRQRGLISKITDISSATWISVKNNALLTGSIMDKTLPLLQ
jgi:hypothetical protein